MATLTMDNPLTPSPQMQLKKVTQDLEECIGGLKHEFEDSGCPITDDSPTLHRFCAKLESLLQTGFKGKTSLFGEKKDYWNYFVDCCASTKDLRDGIKFVKANSELRTSLGRGRAFLRFSLVHQRLADTLQQCVCSTKQTNDWYHARAVWLQPALSSAIINSLYDLTDLQFDLLPRGYDLDTTWPTFARKTFGSPQTWAAPPSRSTSISSLASIPASEIPPPSPLTPTAHQASFNDSQHIEQLNQELNDSESERFSLQVKLETLKETKTMATDKVDGLETKIKELECTNKEHEIQNENLKTQLTLKEKMWTEKEMMYKIQIEQADQNMADLRAELSNGSTVQMNIAELMGKLAIQQKKNATLAIELKTCQLELTSKTQTDAGKTKLIELLDKKIEQLQDQNKRMLVQIESCAADRMRDAAGNKSSHSLIEQTMDRLKRADAINSKLQESNDALRKMLETMEEKTVKLSTMAKEKLTLYKAENTKLQLTVATLSKEIAHLKATGGGGSTEQDSEGANTAMRAGDDAIKAIEGALTEAKKDVDIWKAKYEEAHTELKKVKDGSVSAASVGSSSVEAVLAEQAVIGETASKLLELEQAKEKTQKALDRSREEVKRVLIQKMHVDEEAAMVDARHKQVQSTHQELLTQLAMKEAAVRKLEAELATISDVVEAEESPAVQSEAAAEVAKNLQEEDTFVVAKVRAMLKSKLQLRSDLCTLEALNTSLQKELKMQIKQKEELNSEILNTKLQVAEMKTLVSGSEVDIASKIEEFMSTEGNTMTKDEEISMREKFLAQIELKEKQIEELQLLLQEQKHKFEVYPNTENESEALAKLDAEASKITQGLESKLNEYRERYDFLMDEKVTLESKCRDLETKLKTTKQNLKKADKENKKLLGEREVLRKEVESLKGQVESLTMTNENLSKQMMELEGTIMRSVEDKLTSLQTALGAEKQGRLKLESDLESMRNRNQNNEKLLEQLQSKKRSLEAEYKDSLKKKEGELKTMKRERDLLENKLAGLTTQYDEATTREVTEREEFKMDIDMLQCDLQKANEELEEERIHSQATNKILVDSILQLLGVDFSNDNPGLETMAATMANNLKDTQEKMSEQMKGLDEAVQSVIERDKTIKELQDTVGKDLLKRTELEGQLSSATAQLTSLHGQLTSAKDQVNNLEENLTFSNAELTDLRDELATVNSEMDSVREELSQSGSASRKLEAQILELNNSATASQNQWAAEKEAMNKNINELTLEAGGILKQISALQQKVREQEEDLLHTQMQKEQLEANVCDLRESFSTSQSQWNVDRQTIQEQVSDLEEDVGEKALKITELRDGLKTKDENISQLESTKRELQSNISKLEGKLDILQSERQSEKEDFTKKADELTEEISIKAEELKILTDRLNDNQEIISQMEANKGELESNLANLKDYFSQTQGQLEAEKQSMSKKINDLIGEGAGNLAKIATLQQKIQQQETVIQELTYQTQDQHHQTREEITVREAEISSLKEKMIQQEVEFTSAKEDLQQELSALRFEVSSQQMEHQQALQGLEGHASSIADLVSKLTAQEQLIEMLEKDLELLKRERLLEKNRMLNELEELRQSLVGRDEECRLLNGELKRTSMLLDEERNLSLRFKNELAEVQAYYDSELKKSRSEVELLKKDSEVLKGQLIKIIRDKDELWQKTDKLEYLQRLTVSGSWMDDTDTTNCLACNATFSFMLRKHHCRLCGRIFCYSCCNQWVKTPHSSKKARICNDCAVYHKAEMERGSSEELDVNIIQSAKPPDSGGGKGSGSSLHSPLLQGTDRSQAGASSDVTEDDEAPSSFRPEEDSDDSNEVIYQSQQQPGNRGVSPAVEATLITPNQEEAVSSLATGSLLSPDAASVQGGKGKSKEELSDPDVDDEFYDVITEEEVVQSFHDAAIETDSNSQSSPVLMVEQISQGLIPKEPDLCIKAGKSYQVPVFIDAPGIVLCWEFCTEPKGIHFSVTFRRDMLTSNDQTEVLIPLCPCNSHRQAIQGELIAVKAGLYTLMFDNSSSRFTSKKLNYQLKVRKPEAAD